MLTPTKSKKDMFGSYPNKIKLYNRQMYSLISSFGWRSFHQKFRFFMWLDFVDNLIKRGVDIENVRCSLCNVDNENLDHLLLHCTYSAELWKYFISIFDIQRSFKPSVNEHIQEWGINKEKRKKKNWFILLAQSFGSSGGKGTWQPWQRRGIGISRNPL